MTKENTKEVKTSILVECEGESLRRVVYERWFKGVSIEEIAEETEKVVKEIV